MQPVIDMDEEYSLVLEGGGAKGAYQIGAWKALSEAGVKIQAVAGTSVGALNGALICMGDVKKAEALWQEITYSKVMDVDDIKMQQLFNGEIPLGEALKRFRMLLQDGGADITPLKKLIAENINEEAIRNSKVELYVLTFSVSDFKELDIDIKEVEEGLIEDILLASAYIFPFFKNEKLHGKSYIDGGIINNVPLESLVKRGYKNIISIRIFGIGREKKVKIDDDVTLYTIEPRVRLGNIMDFDCKKSVRNMKLGYYDAMRLIYGLEGKIYYIDQSQKECYYLNQLISLQDPVKDYLAALFNLAGRPGLWLRNYLEIILPKVASELKLTKEWNYHTLYITMLEATARLYRIWKYTVYTPETLLVQVKRKAERAGIDKDLPVFIYIILNELYEEQEDII